MSNLSYLGDANPDVTEEERTAPSGLDQLGDNNHKVDITQKIRARLSGHETSPTGYTDRYGDPIGTAFTD